MAKKYIAVLGTGQQCDDSLKDMAFNLGVQLAKNKLSIVCGGFSGIFEYVFKGSKSISGENIVILGELKVEKIPDYCDHVFTTGIGNGKHILLSNICYGAIVFQGSLGTLALVSEFIILNKPVIILSQTGGIASHLSNNRLIIDSKHNVKFTESVEECANFFM